VEEDVVEEVAVVTALQVAVVMEGDIVDEAIIASRIATQQEEETAEGMTSTILVVAVVQGMIGMMAVAVDLVVLDILRIEDLHLCHLLEWLLLLLRPRF